MKLRLLLITIIVLILAACSEDITPDEVTSDFMREARVLNIHEASLFLTSELKENFENKISENTESGTTSNIKDFNLSSYEGSFKRLSEEMEYDIDDWEVESGERAVVDLSINHVDASQAYVNSIHDIFDYAVGSTFSGEELSEEELLEDTFSIVTNELDEVDIELTKSTGKIELVKEDGEWKISSIDKTVLNALTFGAIDGYEEVIE